MSWKENWKLYVRLLSSIGDYWQNDLRWIKENVKRALVHLNICMGIWVVTSLNMYMFIMYMRKGRERRRRRKKKF